ncbi:putative f-box domain protein [Eutypa lata UCREL1]|uniref:Putative f-box domain protein n=1 Tax=Eutypa lata (strain UCR-EL1) TaxID=1287681 RepID=M7SI48_EUTLA|nr:putative f-box domain protein [Eutypa lata UCREL1]
MALEQLPTEILHGIGEFLTAEETATLRLVSRNVSAKVSRGPFASVLRSKTRLVGFSPRSLQLLVEMTRPGAPGTALESLVLVGVPLGRKGAITSTTTTTTAGGLLYEAEKENDDDDDDSASITALLAEAMRNLNANSEHRGLLSLGLTVDGRAVGKLTSGWVDIWTAASRMFHLTLDALRHSGGLNLAALDLFTRPYCCSLSVANFWRDDLDELLRQCSPSIGNIRRLHVSISRERGRALTIESESESGSSSTVPEEPWPPRDEGTRIVFAHEPDDEVDDADGWGRFRLRRRGEASVRRPVRYAPVEGLQVDWAFRLWVARDKLKYGIPSNCTIEGTDKTAMDYY